MQGNPQKSDSAGSVGSRISQSSSRHGDGFPVIKNSQFISMSREIPGNEAISELRRESLASQPKTGVRDKNSADLRRFGGETSRRVQFGFRSAEFGTLRESILSMHWSTASAERTDGERA
jgi:hypothetical protein